MLPTREEALKLIRDGLLFNPGPWGKHCLTAAHCAEKIASACGDMDVEKAYILGLLHDIGRKFGVRHLGHMLNIGDEGRYAKVFDSSGIMPACGAGKIHCTVDPYGDVKLCPSDEHVLKEEKNNLLEKDMKQIWKDSSVLNWIRGAEFIKCQRCGERCEFSCPLARKERKEEFICSFKQVMH